MLTFNREVIFPHYPTRWAWNEAMKMKDIKKLLTMSPSHAVGSEHVEEFRDRSMMPIKGHHPTRWAWNQAVKFYEGRFRLPASSSHTVGLELSLEGQLLDKVEVAIPHGGLRTLGGPEGYQTVKSVSIPHGGLRTLRNGDRRGEA